MKTVAGSNGYIFLSNTDSLVLQFGALANTTGTELFLFYFLGSAGSTNTSWEHHIRADLLDNYDRKVRPVLRGKKVAEVSFALRVSRLVKVVRKSYCFFFGFLLFLSEDFEAILESILLCNSVLYSQPRSQCLSSYRPMERAKRDPGWVWSRATLTIENIREGTSVINSFSR